MHPYRKINNFKLKRKVISSLYSMSTLFPFFQLAFILHKDHTMGQQWFPTTGPGTTSAPWKNWVVLKCSAKSCNCQPWMWNKTKKRGFSNYFIVMYSVSFKRLGNTAMGCQISEKFCSYTYTIKWRLTKNLSKLVKACQRLTDLGWQKESHG